MVSTAEGVTLIAAETARLKEYLQGTSSEDWQLDSPCEGWTVGDVIGHLGWAAEFFADSISQARYGVTTAPEGLPEIGSIPSAEIPGFIAQMAKEYSQFADTELVQAFSSSVDRLDALFSDIEDDEWSKECWGLRLLRPAEDYVTIRISELVIHSWDIRFPSYPQARISPDCLPVVLERLPVWLNELGLAEFSPSEPDQCFRFQTTGATDFQCDVVIGDQEDEVEEVWDGEPDGELDGEPTATLTCDADVLALLVWGRLQPAQVLADGRLTVSNGSGDGAEFASWLSR